MATVADTALDPPGAPTPMGGSFACSGRPHPARPHESVPNQRCRSLGLRPQPVTPVTSVPQSGARRVWVRGDSKLVIQQLSGAYKVNSPALLSLHAEARRLAEGFDDVRFEHVTRQANQRADALANQAMNAQGSIADPAKATAAPPSVQSAPGAGASATTAPDHADAERN